MSVGCRQVGDLRDDHAYPGPYSSGATATRASVNGEYGGLCLYLDGHSWNSMRSDAIQGFDCGDRAMDNTTMLQVCSSAARLSFMKLKPAG